MHWATKSDAVIQMKVINPPRKCAYPHVIEIFFKLKKKKREREFEWEGKVNREKPGFKNVFDGRLLTFNLYHV